MAIDVTVLCVVLFFGLLGALSGAARQLGHLLALVAAVLLARPLGAWLTPLLVDRAGVPGPLGSVSGAILGFLAVYLVVRVLTTPLLQRAFAGREEEHAGTDRWFGFVLGALKATAVLYFLFSAATFVEANVEVGGRRLDFGLRRSVTGALAHRFNLFSRTKEPAAPEKGKRARNTRTVRADREPRALPEDPRLRRLLADPEVAEALRSGDWDALLQDEEVRRVAADPELLRQLEAAARR